MIINPDKCSVAVWVLAKTTRSMILPGLTNSI